MAGRTVAQAAHEVGATVPLSALNGLRNKAARAEIKRPPDSQRRLGIKGPSQGVCRWSGGHCRQALQISVQGVAVGAADLRVAGVRKRRVEQLAVLGAAVVQGAPEVTWAPVPEACVAVGREVAGEHRTEGRVDTAPAGIRRTAGHRVAAHAVACAAEVFAAFQQGSTVKRLGLSGRRGFVAGVQQPQQTGQQQSRRGGPAEPAPKPCAHHLAALLAAPAGAAVAVGKATLPQAGTGTPAFTAPAAAAGAG